jgi:hypothetical protein
MDVPGRVTSKSSFKSTTSPIVCSVAVTTVKSQETLLQVLAYTARVVRHNIVVATSKWEIDVLA